MAEIGAQLRPQRASRITAMVRACVCGYRPPYLRAGCAVVDEVLHVGLHGQLQELQGHQVLEVARARGWRRERARRE